MRIAAILGVAVVLAIAGTAAARSAPTPPLPEPVVLSARPPADLGGGGFEIVPPVVEFGDRDAEDWPGDGREGDDDQVDRTADDVGGDGRDRVDPPDDGPATDPGDDGPATDPDDDDGPATDPDDDGPVTDDDDDADDGPDDDDDGDDDDGPDDDD